MKNKMPQETNKEGIKRMIKEHYPKIALAIALLSVPQSCFALFGGDGPAVATETTQVAQWIADEVGRAQEYAKQVQQYAVQTQNLQQNIQTVQIGYQNLEALSAMDISNFNSYIDQLSSVMSATNGIAYNMATLDQKFTENFPGYEDHKNRAMTGSIADQASSFAAYYKSLTDANRGTALGTLRNLKAVNQDLRDDALSMNMLKLQSRNAVGNKAVIQAANEIALHQTDTLKKLHSSILNQTNLMAQVSAQKNEEAVAARAKTTAWKENSLTRTKGNEHSVKTWRE
jgi:P-type conjugative transfer protein TrbJ